MQHLLEKLGDGFAGALWGVFFGGLAGLGVCIWAIDTPPLFPGDTVVIGAALLGLLGFVFGRPLLDLIGEHWHRFF